jgi:hypothetical protein
MRTAQLVKLIEGILDMAKGEEKARSARPVGRPRGSSKAKKAKKAPKNVKEDEDADEDEDDE